MSGEFTGHQEGLLFVKDASRLMPIAIRVCTRCGAVVVDEDLHNVWHDTLEARP